MAGNQTQGEGHGDHYANRGYHTKLFDGLHKGSYQRGKTCGKL